MRDFLITLVANMLSIALTAYIVPGIGIPDSLTSLAIIALVFGFINALVRPILTILSLPFVIVTLGLFILVINAAMLGLTAWLTPLTISGFWSAVLGAIIIGLINMILSSFLQDERKSHISVHTS